MTIRLVASSTWKYIGWCPFSDMTPIEEMVIVYDPATEVRLW